VVAASPADRTGRVMALLGDAYLRSRQDCPYRADFLPADARPTGHDRSYAGPHDHAGTLRDDLPLHREPLSFCSVIVSAASGAAVVRAGHRTRKASFACDSCILPETNYRVIPCVCHIRCR
jgi:hypothetical protein